MVMPAKVVELRKVLATNGTDTSRLKKACAAKRWLKV